jgi:hypothetical protein
MLDGTVKYLGEVLAKYRDGLQSEDILNEPRKPRVPLRESLKGKHLPQQNPLDLVFGNGFAGPPIRGGHMPDRRRWAARKAENTNHICYSTRNAIEGSILTARRAGI